MFHLSVSSARKNTGTTWQTLVLSISSGRGNCLRIGHLLLLSGWCLWCIKYLISPEKLSWRPSRRGWENDLLFLSVYCLVIYCSRPEWIYWKMGDFLASYVSYETFEPPTFLIQSISPIPPQIRLSCGVICKDHCGELLVGQQFFSRDWGHPQKPTTIGGESKIWWNPWVSPSAFHQLHFFLTQKFFTQTILRDGSTSASFKQTDLLWLQLRKVQNSYEIHYTDWFIWILKMAS